MDIVYKILGCLSAQFNKPKQKSRNFCSSKFSRVEFHCIPEQLCPSYLIGRKKERGQEGMASS